MNSSVRFRVFQTSMQRHQKDHARAKVAWLLVNLIWPLVPHKVPRTMPGVILEHRAKCEPGTLSLPRPLPRIILWVFKTRWLKGHEYIFKYASKLPIKFFLTCHCLLFSLWVAEEWNFHKLQPDKKKTRQWKPYHYLGPCGSPDSGVTLISSTTKNNVLF